MYMHVADVTMQRGVGVTATASAYIMLTVNVFSCVALQVWRIW